MPESAANSRKSELDDVPDSAANSRKSELDDVPDVAYGLRRYAASTSGLWNAVLAVSPGNFRFRG